MYVDTKTPLILMIVNEEEEINEYKICHIGHREKTNEYLLYTDNFKEAFRIIDKSIMEKLMINEIVSVQFTKVIKLPHSYEDGEWFRAFFSKP